ncbi:major facilitator superfamily domain-containing protein [Cunninghamella echinulata]|nr:major facilitator superfamily domain-containing protein [Cunninghamella echinulata]
MEEMEVERFPDLTREVKKWKVWIMVFFATLINIMTFGISFSFGIFQDEYKKNILKNESNLAISFIGTIAGSLTYLLSVAISRYLYKENMKWIMLSGSILMSLGLILASFSTRLWQFYITQGFMFGLGSSMVYIPSISSIPQWFNENRALAMGIVSSGTGIGGLIFSPFTNYLITKYSWEWCLRIMGIIIFITMISSSLIIKQRYQVNKPLAIINKPIVKNNKFILSCLSTLFQSTGYLVPLYFMPEYSQTLGFTVETSSLFLGIHNGLSAFGKITLGLIADKYGRQNMIFSSCLISTLSVFCLWMIKSKNTFIAFNIIYAMTSGNSVSLFPTVIADIFGIENFSTVNSLTYFIRGVGTLVGTPLGGYILDVTNEFVYIIIYVGISLALATIFILLLRLYYKKKIV